MKTSKETRIIDIRKSESRFHSKIGWLESWHSFSFGQHYDPTNTNFGLLLVNNEDIIQPATGFGTHPHDNMEIVTWIFSGELEHEDSMGNKGIIYPGLAQRMSAGSGIFHSEKNPSKTTPCHLTQMWVLPDTKNIQPSYEQKDITTEMNKDGLFPIASGRGHPGAVKIQQKGAVLWGAKLKPGETIKIPNSSQSHIFVPIGNATLEGSGQLSKGDVARMTPASSAESLHLSADSKEGAEILIWEMSLV